MQVLNIIYFSQMEYIEGFMFSYKYLQKFPLEELQADTYVSDNLFPKIPCANLSVCLYFCLRGSLSANLMHRENRTMTALSILLSL